MEDVHNTNISSNIDGIEEITVRETPVVSKIDFKEIEKIRKFDEIKAWMESQKNDIVVLRRESEYFSKNPDKKPIFLPEWVVLELKSGNIEVEEVINKFGVTQQEIDKMLQD